MKSKAIKIASFVLALTLLTAVFTAFGASWQDESDNIEPTEVPLLVIIASFDANGNGKDDFDASNPSKLYSDKTKDYYGEQWAATKPEDHYDWIFGKTNRWSLTNFYKEMTLGRVYYVPAQFDKKVPGQFVEDGILSVVLKMKHPGASNAAATTISAIIKATDEYVDFSKFDKNRDGKVTQTELGIVIFNAGADHAYTGTYANTSYPKGYFAVHGTSQTNSVTLDGVKLTSENAKGNISNMGEYATVGNHITLGVIAHELAHNLGAEDLYERNPGYGGIKIGGWPMPYYFSLQCLGNNAGGGARPAYEDPYHRLYLGWADQQICDGEGEYTLYSTMTGKYKVLRINTPDPMEYFLVEVRYGEGFEASMLGEKQGGILVWHIDDAINSVNFSGGNACTPFYTTPGATSPHDPGIVPLFRTGWNKKGTLINSTRPSGSAACYYLSDDPTTAIFDSSNFHSPTNGTTSLNSYPSNWIGPETYNLHIEVLSKPGQEMKIKVSTQMNAVLTPNITVSSTAQTLTSLTLSGTVISANGDKLDGFGFILSKENEPTRENGTFVPATLSDDGKNFTATIEGLEQSTRYFFVSCASNENGEAKSSIASMMTQSPAMEKTYFLVRMYKNLKGDMTGLTEKKVKFGETLTYTFPMERKGYTFVGWYLDEDYTEQYDMSYTQNEYGVITLYAKWEEGEFETTTTQTTTAETTTEQTTVLPVTETTSTTVQTTAQTETTLETTSVNAPAAEEKSGGCRSSVGVGASMIIAAFAGVGAVILRKKRK
ncbi:MAG: InlB B-repeat-containing protein [Clostridia bacterium]|nr:InlB B-repeat-containing protein [Clostridia bacterium]